MKLHQDAAGFVDLSHFSYFCHLSVSHVSSVCLLPVLPPPFCCFCFFQFPHFAPLFFTCVPKEFIRAGRGEENIAESFTKQN